MTVYTVMAWNDTRILVEHVDSVLLVDEALWRLRRELRQEVDDLRWQSWPGKATVVIDGREWTHAQGGAS